MSLKSVLTNEFSIEFDEDSNELLIYTVDNGVRASVPIRHSMATLLELGKEDACKFVGQTILLLVPKIRTELFDENV